VRQNGEQEAEATWEEEGKGERTLLAPDKGHPGMGSGGDRRLRALRYERDHRTVTRSVASGMGVVTGTHG
jgi:hypothetical protein